MINWLVQTEVVSFQMLLNAEKSGEEHQENS